MNRLKCLLMLLVIFCHSNVIHTQMTISEFNDVLSGFRRGCLERYPELNETLVTELAEHKFPDDNEDLKCFVNCVFEGTRFFKKGELNLRQAKKMIRIYAPESYQAGILNYVESCKHIQREEDGDICQWAWEIVKCFDKADPILVYGWIPNEEGAEIPKKPEADGNEDDEDDLI